MMYHKTAPFIISYRSPACEWRSAVTHDTGRRLAQMEGEPGIRGADVRMLKMVVACAGCALNTRPIVESQMCRAVVENTQ
jgi:hypothetical protein